MGYHSVTVTLKVRNGAKEDWAGKVLALGEFGLENDTLKLKIGDGHSQWENLPYITSNSGDNNFNSNYFRVDSNGYITLQEQFVNAVIQKDGEGIVDNFSVYTPTDGANELSVVNKTYVDNKIISAINDAPHLKRIIVNEDELPLPEQADSNTIYMVLDKQTPESGDQYKEYMLINSAIVQIGDTSVNLKKLVSGQYEKDHLIGIDEQGSLVDSGYDKSVLSAATSTKFGVVKSGNGAQIASDPGYNRIIVDNSGFMTVNHVPTTALYVPAGETFIIDGGTASGAPGVDVNG